MSVPAPRRRAARLLLALVVVAPVFGGCGLILGGEAGILDPVNDAALSDGALVSDSSRDAASDGLVATDGAESGPPGPGCVGLAATCGGNKDCCASSVVEGGTFNRSNDVAYPATVSDFKLDAYEVTVGRFRAFVNAGNGTQASPPAPGDGAHPKIPGSGWAAGFNASLATNSGALRVALNKTVLTTWTDAPSGSETRPINGVTWFEALAFCAWDRGRLPTEAEWNYAAAGGSQQRDYPWGGSIDPSKASYDCAARDGGFSACQYTDILPVGSKSPQGDGRWGQTDLAGNVNEWSLDWSASPYRLAQCNNCGDLQTADNRVLRGGGYIGTGPTLKSSSRSSYPPDVRFTDLGFRCARTAVP